MVTIKKPEEIKIIAQGGKILAEILNMVIQQAVQGRRTIELDQLAEKEIIRRGGRPAFKNYRGRFDEVAFPTTLCTSVNDQLVHVPAGNYRLQTGDMLNIDVGMQYPAQGGLFTDMAVTIPIGKVSQLTRKLIKVTKRSLELGIKQVRPGNHISDISRAIQTYVESQGFSVVRQLVGHGVGYQVHEDPHIPNYVDKSRKDIELKEGMVLAIEPMVSTGDYLIKTLNDEWSIVMADGSLGAHFEHTVAVTKDGCKVLTDFNF